MRCYMFDLGRISDVSKREARRIRGSSLAYPKPPPVKTVADKKRKATALIDDSLSSTISTSHPGHFDEVLNMGSSFKVSRVSRCRRV